MMIYSTAIKTPIARAARLRLDTHMAHGAVGFDGETVEILGIISRAVVQLAQVKTRSESLR